MKRLLGMIGLLFPVLLLGCGASLNDQRVAGAHDAGKLGASEPPSARCISLDGRRQDWGGIGKGTGVLSGAAGLGTVATDDKTARLGLAIGSIVSAGVATMAAFIADGADSSWARECSR